MARVRGLSGIGIALLLLTPAASDAIFAGDAASAVPESPATPVALPFPTAPPRAAAPALPADLLARASSLTLADVVDVALRTSPRTRETWALARSAAAEVDEVRAAYYPDLDFTANVTKSEQAAVGGRFSTKQTVYGPALALNYLLLDFGGRKGDAEEALARLHAAGWTHNAVIQDVVLSVQEAYYEYLNAKAQLEATQVSLAEANANLEAAETRRQSGVATIAEVLQARTARSQIELILHTFEGNVRTLLGALATSMGLPANTAIEVEALRGDPPVDAAGEDVERLIDSALAARPDLAGARALAEAAQGAVLSARSQRLPTLQFAGSANRTYYSPSEFASSSDNWSLALLLRFPVFDGFERRSRQRRLEEDLAAARARAEQVEQQVTLDVWQSYYDTRTAADQVRTSRDLLASAEETEKVTLARYKEGVGSVLDLLTSQSSLALARAQAIRARSDWFIALARLARATGALGPVPPAAPAARTGEAP